MTKDGLTGRQLATSLRLTVGTVAFIAFQTCTALPSALAAGEFDPSFGTAGKFVNPLGEGTRPGADITQVAIQADGKIVLAGNAAAAGSKAVVARLDPAGTLDQSFGVAGRLLDRLQAGPNEAPSLRAMALAPDGKIVVGGRIVDFVAQRGRLFVARVDTGGSLDPSFDGEGEVLMQVGGGPTPDSGVSGVTHQSDGKILVVGNATDGNGRNAALVARLDTGGGFDPSFGTAGKVIQQLGTGANPGSNGFALVLHSDGKILIGGGATVTDDQFDRAVFLARLSADGKSLDSTFGDGGKVVTRLGTEPPNIAALSALALQPDGKIVVGGYSLDDGSRQEFLVARLNADGKGLDQGFASGGVLRIQLGGQTGSRLSEVRALALQPDGKIVAVGQATGPAGDAQVLVARLRTDGTFDPSFGSTGTVITPLAPSYSLFNAAALQPDGKVVVGGDSVDDSLDTHALVARLILDAPPSAAFTAAPNPAEPGQPVSFDGSSAVDPDGAIVGYGWDFGDGTTADGATANHTYAGVGTFTAMLTVRDDYGLSTGTSQAITVEVAAGGVPGSCGTQRVPRAIKRGLKRASGSIDRAAATEKAALRARLLGRAGKTLGKVSKAIDRGEGRKRRPLSAECTAALRRGVKAAEARIAALGS